MVNRDTKYKFPVYQNTTDALTENVPVDIYDPKLPRKHWVDSNPQVNSDGECEYKVFQVKGNLVQIDTETGLPKFKTLRISPEWAKRLNIYDPKFANSTTPDTEVGSVPIPIRELKEGERWKFGFLSEPTIEKVVNGPILPDVTSSYLETLVKSIAERIDSVEEKLNRLIVIMGSK